MLQNKGIPVSGNRGMVVNIREKGIRKGFEKQLP